MSGIFIFRNISTAYNIIIAIKLNTVKKNMFIVKFLYEKHLINYIIKK
nr:MAG TPA: hypothetical protein [Caudoviricetes sp.]